MLTNKETPDTNAPVINEIKNDDNATLDDNDVAGELEPFNEDDPTEEVNNDNITIANGDPEENDEEDDDDDEDIIDESEFDEDEGEEGNKNKEKEFEEKDFRKN